MAIIPLASRTPLELMVGGRSVLTRVLETLTEVAQFNRIIIAPQLAVGWVTLPDQEKVICCAPQFGRLNAVRAALNMAERSELETVVLHDADRPLTSPAMLQAILAGTTEQGGIAGATPVKSAFKKVEAGVVSQTVARDCLVQLVGISAFCRVALDAILEYAAGHPELPDDEIQVAVAAMVTVAVHLSTVPSFQVDDVITAELAERLTDR
ncbi:MAG: 2-C-methyl-D-erythritol 4-phosphate cytidylyltransferase [Candidatus Dormibacteraceae bacterium]